MRQVIRLSQIALAFILMGLVSLPAQTATNIQVSSTIQQSAVHSLGINLADQTFYDSGQMLKNLIYRNPGFEPMKYRSILSCASVTANTCVDSTGWSPQPTAFWTGGTYLVLSGSAQGKSGKVVSSTKNTVACATCGQIVKFDQNLTLAPGDSVAVTNTFAGHGDQGWWTSSSGGGSISTESNDLSTETPGTQAIRINASGAGQWASISSYFDTTAGISFLQLNGNYQVTFRAKCTAGNKNLSIEVARQAASISPYLNRSLTVTNAWADYTVNFSASESGSAIGNLGLTFSAYGAAIQLDDVSLTQTNTDPTNTTVFRDPVVNALKQLKPGTLRMMASNAALGADIADQLATPFARYREGYFLGSNEVDDIPYGIPEFLGLCHAVGADPWITIPTATTPAEISALVEYLTGTGADPYSAARIKAGQLAPWTTVFGQVHLELGNENWNGIFAGETMNYPAYPAWANQVFAAARKTSGFTTANFDLVLNGWSSVPWYNSQLLATANQQDSIDIAPYLLLNANNEAQTTLFGALFAEPELFDANSGIVPQTIQDGNAAAHKTRVSVYETNLSPTGGTITQTQLNQLAPSVAAGIAATEHMLLMMRDGIQFQNAFALPQYQIQRSDQKTVRIWGTVVDMGNTNRRRPQFITEAMANAAIAGNLITTTQTGANPTWNQPPSSDGVQLSGAHYLQSFAFQNGTTNSVIVFNLNQTTALPITFSGANAPTGTVTQTQLTSAHITDNNETASVVAPTSTILAGFSPAKGITLPACSMTVLTWVTGK